MKNLCKRPIEDQIKSNRILIIVMAVFILLSFVLLIIDVLKGNGIDATRTSLFCSLTCIMCCLEVHTRKLQAEVDKKSEEKIEEKSEEE